MARKKNKKEVLVLIVISILSMLVFSNFDITKNVQNGILPVAVLFPLLFIFFYVNLSYIKFSYKEGKTNLQKITYVILNSAITILLFFGGFEFWRLSHGNIDVLFSEEIEKVFKINFRNIYFWAMYQTLFLIYAFSILKILVSKTKS